jgi:hypothetical protein
MGSVTPESISARVVLYGPPGSGKARTLELLASKLKQGQGGDLEQREFGGSTCDVLPVQLGEIKGKRTTFEFVAAPASWEEEAARRTVLQGVDGIIFVANSLGDAIDDNQRSLEELESFLAGYGKSLVGTPVVFQWNNQQEAGAVQSDELAAQLNRVRAPSFPVSEGNPKGIFQAFTTISKITLKKVREDFDAGRLEDGSAVPAGSGAMDPTGISGDPGGAVPEAGGGLPETVAAGSGAVPHAQDEVPTEVPMVQEQPVPADVFPEQPAAAETEGPAPEVGIEGEEGFEFAEVAEEPLGVASLLNTEDFPSDSMRAGGADAEQLDDLAPPQFIEQSADPVTGDVVAVDDFGPMETFSDLGEELSEPSAPAASGEPELRLDDLDEGGGPTEPEPSESAEDFFESSGGELSLGSEGEEASEPAADAFGLASDDELDDVFSGLEMDADEELAEPEMSAPDVSIQEPEVAPGEVMPDAPSGMVGVQGAGLRLVSADAPTIGSDGTLQVPVTLRSDDLDQEWQVTLSIRLGTES